MRSQTRGAGVRERRSRFAVVRTEGCLVAANGVGLGVRGRPRTDVPPTLWMTSIHAELAPRPRQVLAAALLPHRQVVATRRVLAGRSVAAFERDGVLDSQHAALVAEHVAARLLGLEPVLSGRGARVLSVDPDGPCAALLRPGDVVVAVDGAPVSTAGELRLALAGRARAGLTVLPVASGRAEGAPRVVRVHNGHAGLGLGVATHRPALDSGLDLDVHPDEDSIGPSAGLVLALAVLDVLTPGSLTGGRHVAGTGSLALDGSVGEVAGVRHKARAAARCGVEVLLAPASQADEALQGARGSALRVAPVRHVEDALRVLVELGGEPAVLPPPADPAARTPRPAVPEAGTAPAARGAA